MILRWKTEEVEKLRIKYNDVEFGEEYTNILMEETNRDKHWIYTDSKS